MNHSAQQEPLAAAHFLDANVDAEEIAKFEAIASQWWDMQGEFAPLHAINPLRLGFVHQHAGDLSGKAVVDVGCGGGILSEGMARDGAAVTGIDMGAKPLAIAKLHLHESGLQVDYRQSTAEALAAEQAGHFDVVTCMEMLEHVPEPAAVVAACAQLAKPGGWVFFSTLNRKPKSWLMAVAGAEYVLGMLPKGTHDYAKFIKPSELSGWARAAGLQVTAGTGLHYNPLLKNYSLGGNMDVNYLLACRRR